MILFTVHVFNKFIGAYQLIPKIYELPFILIVNKKVNISRLVASDNQVVHNYIRVAP